MASLLPHSIGQKVTKALPLLKEVHFEDCQRVWGGGDCCSQESLGSRVSHTDLGQIQLFQKPDKQVTEMLLCSESSASDSMSLLQWLPSLLRVRVRVGSMVKSELEVRSRVQLSTHSHSQMFLLFQNSLPSVTILIIYQQRGRPIFNKIHEHLGRGGSHFERIF